MLLNWQNYLRNSTWIYENQMRVNTKQRCWNQSKVEQADICVIPHTTTTLIVKDDASKDASKNLFDIKYMREVALAKR